MRKKSNLQKVSKLILKAGLATALVHVIHAVTLDRMIEFKEVPFYSPDVPKKMNGYRIAFISDTHFMPEDRLTAIAQTLNKKKADLLILGGDAHTDRNALRRTMEILSRVTVTDGVYGVEGNHDDCIELFAAMEECGICPLSNSGIHVRDGFYLAGVEDVWNRSPSVACAVAGAMPGDFVVLVSHNPDIAMLQGTADVDLILSGHTHGGQVTFFGVFAPALIPSRITDCGQRFMSGWASSRDGVPVYVSNGACGNHKFPRVFARPQVALITLFSRC